LTLPIARRAVAAAILVQVAARPALPAIAFAEVQSPVALVSPAVPAAASGVQFAPLQAQGKPNSAERLGAVEYRVKRGDTLWSIAERYYGTGEEFDRLIDANAGKRMPDGRIFDRAGLIYPDWVLDVPLPSVVIEEHDGARWYVVRRGDTMRGIASHVLGDEARYRELFDLNVGARCWRRDYAALVRIACSCGEV
jgi:nucleoid-associated protein YgaU